MESIEKIFFIKFTTKIMKFKCICCFVLLMISWLTMGQDLSPPSYRDLLLRNSVVVSIEQLEKDTDSSQEIIIKQALKLFSQSLNQDKATQLFAADVLATAYIKNNQEEKALQYVDFLKFLDIDTSFGAKHVSNYILSQIYLKQGKNSEALNLLSQSINEVESSNDLFLYSQMLVLQADINGRQGDFLLAVTELLKAVEIFETYNSKQPLANTYNNLSVLYIRLKNFQEALKFNIKAHDLNEELNNRKLMAILQSNRGYIYGELGQLDKELAALEIASAMAIELDMKKLLVTTNNNYSDILFKNGDYLHAKDKAQLALKGALADNDVNAINIAKVNIGQADIRLGNTKQGFILLREALVGFENTKEAGAIIEMYKVFSDSFVFLKDYVNAYDWQKKHFEAQTSFLFNKRDSQIAKIQEEYSAKEREQQIISLQKENELSALRIDTKNLQRNFALVVLIASLAIILLIYNRYSYSKRLNKSLYKKNLKLSDVSMRDSLTGLFNRRFISKEYIESLNKLDFNETKIALLMVDIDHFKLVNDTYGHDIGDLILKEFSSRLERVFRENDQVIRWGGEEFLIIAKISCVNGITQVVNRLLMKITASHFLKHSEHPMSITASVGICMYPYIETNDVIWEQAIHHADKALYEAKNNGRNRAYMYTVNAQGDSYKLIERDIKNVSVL